MWIYVRGLKSGAALKREKRVIAADHFQITGISHTGTESRHRVINSRIQGRKISLSNYNNYRQQTFWLHSNLSMKSESLISAKYTISK